MAGPAAAVWRQPLMPTVREASAAAWRWPFALPRNLGVSASRLGVRAGRVFSLVATRAAAPPRPPAVPDMVASIRKSKKFKQLASYAIQCLEKVRRMAPPARLRPSPRCARVRWRRVSRPPRPLAPLPPPHRSR